MAASKNSAMDILNHRRARRPGRLIALFGLAALIALAIWLAFALLRSMPTQPLVMAVYPEGSPNDEVAEQYRKVLSRKGFDLKLVPSAGAVESVARLRDPKSGTSIALIPGGITTEQGSPELVSLGTLYYQPLWVFSRGSLPQKHESLQGPRVSIGPE